MGQFRIFGFMKLPFYPLFTEVYNNKANSYKMECQPLVEKFVVHPWSLSLIKFFARRSRNLLFGFRRVRQFFFQLFLRSFLNNILSPFTLKKIKNKVLCSTKVVNFSIELNACMLHVYFNYISIIFWGYYFISYITTSNKLDWDHMQYYKVLHKHAIHLLWLKLKVTKVTFNLNHSI